ncbi:MAG: hypothetical protein FJX23_10145 [Alphaproteobacteria bacterium]|nr:hypothetical protein [Alphaproteobacteria bacterium]
MAQFLVRSSDLQDTLGLKSFEITPRAGEFVFLDNGEGRELYFFVLAVVHKPGKPSEIIVELVGDEEDFAQDFAQED